MSSKILFNSTPRNVKSGPSTDSLYENVGLDEPDSDPVGNIYENLSHYHRHANNHQIIYDVPKSNEKFIYAQPKSSADINVDSLIPQAARLLLAQNCKNEENNSVGAEGSDEEDFEEDIGLDNENENDCGRGDGDDEYDIFTTDEFRDTSFNDYGLEVIQEETESQMSSSDTESDHEQLDRCVEFSTETLRQRRSHDLDQIILGQRSPSPDVLDYSASGSIINNDEEENASNPDEIVAKHIKIPSDWDPKPLLARLHIMVEPKPCSRNEASQEIMAGHMQILSGNRKKGTFWNAWRRKYCVLTAGKLVVYGNNDCQDIFQEVQLCQGGKVDVLDPVEFVGIEKGKSMINRILGVDDGQGRYYVFQCSSTGECVKWAESIQQEMSSNVYYHTPVLPKSPAIFRDIVLIDIGSTNIRAGVLTHQPTLPKLFFSAVMSETEDGRIIFGNDAYLPENRKKAKIRFPFESSSKLCQNTLDIRAVKELFNKIFSDLNINVENYRVIINLPRIVDNTCRRKILELLFQDFCARSAMLYHQSLAAFFAYSVDNGIICDIGERCDIIPVSTGFVLSNGWSRAPFGGTQLKHSLRQGLGPQENGLYLSTPIENLVLRFIAENFICVNSGGSKRPSQDSQEIVVEMDLRDVLPFSNLIGVSQDVLRNVAEGFFDPGYYGLDCESLQKLLLKSIQACGVDIRKEASQNIFLTGGCSLIPGFAERLEIELTKICPSHIKPKIKCSPYRYHASFIGSSIMASTDAYEKSLILKANYESKKCPPEGPTHWFQFR